MSESERSEAFGTPDAAEVERLRREVAALREQLEGSAARGLEIPVVCAT